MAIEHKTGLFYELMIRGSHDPQVAPLGTVLTFMLLTGSALVDTETNKLVAPYAPDPARDLTKDEAAAFLGDKMAGFLDQLTAERAATAVAVKALAAKTAEHDALVVSHQVVTANRDALKTTLATVVTALQAAPV